jgi:hypothetical protein
MSRSAIGSGLISTADNADHVTAAAPIAHASVAMDASVVAGLFLSRRNASLTSSIASSCHFSRSIDGQRGCRGGKYRCFDYQVRQLSQTVTAKHAEGAKAPWLSTG